VSRHADHTPSFRWHEHDPLEIVTSVEKCIDEAVQLFQDQGHSINSIKAVGITNQRETTVVWNKETGEPLYNAIVWTDTRTQALIRKLKHRLGADRLQDLCGLPLSTYPSVGKLLWLLENVSKVKEAYDKGVLAFGTIDSWLVYKLNGGECILLVNGCRGMDATLNASWHLHRQGSSHRCQMRPTTGVIPAGRWLTLQHDRTQEKCLRFRSVQCVTDHVHESANTAI